jgi:Leucine-rich repeat (LRR) protein
MRDTFICIAYAIFVFIIVLEMTTSELDSHNNHDAVYCPKAQKILSAIVRGEKLTRVDLSDCGLTSIPDAVFLLGECLEFLNLGGNMISTLPDSMVVFQKLRILFFAQNKFTHIPKVLGKLSTLYMLSFKSNQLCMIDDASLSPSICWLILTDNDISELPSSIGKLTGLRKLMLAGNRITHLNEELQNCRVRVPLHLTTICST